MAVTPLTDGAPTASRLSAEYAQGGVLLPPQVEARSTLTTVVWPGDPKMFAAAALGSTTVVDGVTAGVELLVDVAVGVPVAVAVLVLVAVGVLEPAPSAAVSNGSRPTNRVRVTVATAANAPRPYFFKLTALPDLSVAVRLPRIGQTC
ncbi:hypothetical protein [Nocardioides baekrokdamisoli]|uniref:hypothetical protein n=1 Tax=Nocardioides baekrokdamisoli TaxID=1804624 RepID=UPI0013DE14C8|nr:hypothetical protein [Nocardioides baekrokdamisoli]